MAAHRSNLEVSPPQNLLASLNIPELLLCGPGPVNLSPGIKEAISLPIPSPNSEEYFEVLEQIKDGIRYVFQTHSKLVLAISGSGHAGMEAMLSNVLEPGDTLLVPARGIWDIRATEICTRKGIIVKVIQHPPYQPFSLEELEEGIKKYRPTAIFLTHGDSSTGTLQQIDGVGDVCRKYKVLSLVDTVVSLCAIPFRMDAWKIDAVYTSLQKGMGGPAGISPIAFGDRAEKKIMSRKTPCLIFYMDVKLLAEQWSCYKQTRSYHHTLSPPLVYALRACLSHVAREGLQASWSRHAHAAQHFRAGMSLRGATFFVPVPEDRLDTVTTIILPPGYCYAAVIKVFLQKHGIVIYPGLGPSAGKCLRIGLMGVNATEQVADRLLRAYDEALLKCKPSQL